MLAAALSGAVLPWFFAGEPVFWLGNTYGFDEPLTPLTWSITNVSQIINALLLATLLVYAHSQAGVLGGEKRLAAGLFLGFGASLALSLAQRLAIIGAINPWHWFQRSANPGYVYGEGWVSDVPRAPWPFSEPSYASVWFSALAAGGFTLLVFTHRRWLGGLLLVLGGCGLANSLGLTGFVGLLSTMFVVTAARLSILIVERNHERLHRKVTIFLIGIGLAATAALALTLLLSTVEITDRFSQELLSKFRSELNPEMFRFRSNLHAWELVKETYGFGVGIGSNRASSYLASLASNMGVPGLLAFMFLLIQHLSGLASLPRSPLTLFVLSGTLAAFIGIAAGIPDFAWPAWWIWIIAGVVLFTQQEPVSNFERAT